ncbi:MAG TPA: hypothetical protein VGE34_02795 [Candidatus Saccharimonadales bacterium]
MSSILRKALQLITGDESAIEAAKMTKMPRKMRRPFKKLTERELIQLESEIGRTLFGSIPDGHRREFFNLDANTWIWHEEYTDESGLAKETTTRYEVQEKGILKAQDGANYTYLEGEELQNFGVAVQMYFEQVMRGVYNRDPKTGHKLG